MTGALCAQSPPLRADHTYAGKLSETIAIQKYLDHLPLERQVRIMAREGLTGDSQTLWDQIDQLARLLGSAHEALHAYVLTQAVLGRRGCGTRSMCLNC